MRRRVALKVLSRHQGPSEKAERRFQHEAWIQGKLEHPAIVRVYEQGEWEELHYYAMELVDGMSLDDVIVGMKERGSDEDLGLRFDTPEYRDWVLKRTIESAEALEHAHRHGVVHRDIKPANLLFSRELKTIRIVDFGLALDATATRLTTSDKIMGTIPYMSPEQVRGQRDIDLRTDVYSLGVTLFQLLTLHLPYRADSQQQYMARVLSEVPRRAGTFSALVGPQLEIVIQKALEKSPADRYASAAQLAKDLQNVLESRPIVARAPSHLTRMGRWVRRRPLHASLLGSAVAGSVLLVVLSLLAAQRGRQLRTAEMARLRGEIRWLNQGRRYEELLVPANQLLELEPADLPTLRTISLAQLSLAQAATDHGRAERLAEQALATNREIQRRAPAASWPHALRAYILNRLGRSSEAKVEETAALRLRGASLGTDEVWFDAWDARDSGDYERAIRLLSEVIARSPHAAEAYSDRGVVFEWQGKTKEAINDYRVAVGINPDEPLYRLQLTRQLVDAGSFDEGELFLRGLLESYPDDARVRQIAAQDFIQRARSLHESGDTAGALTFYAKAESEARLSLKSNPVDLWSWVDLGHALAEQYRLTPDPPQRLLTEAVQCFERGIAGRTDPPKGDDRRVWVGAKTNLCDAAIQTGQLETAKLGKAVEACTEVTRIAPEDPVGFYNLAGALALMGRSDEALAALERDYEKGDRDWKYLSQDPWFASLATDPRFSRLLEKMKG